MTLDQSISLGTGITNQALKWRHNEHDGVSNLQRLGCLLTRLFRRRSKKIWKLRFTGLCGGNSPVTGAFPSQRASNAEKLPFNDVIVIPIYIWVLRGPSIHRSLFTHICVTGIWSPTRLFEIVEIKDVLFKRNWNIFIEGYPFKKWPRF